ncbi:hypothetical protein EPUS_05422 [Endocarpon pusillum Z07020]|uniref:Cupin type-1 domain-containing protein n=1 Tax=Endocarpon pusillum (strain Z07020 / HMAS-L-300199) TaxID=1263415 RepID=U1HI58_ENDPU|nr:uncharacterized protein EPUS_05422 [Endocarpon pusillum Z07020]ERF69880.1 hypothetical protein EPUS_05422 [Endocarpon pusillum Z07020]
MPLQPPEEYHIHTPTPHVPNSRLPVLIYRSVLPLPPNEKEEEEDTAGSESRLNHPCSEEEGSPAFSAAGAARQAIEANHWYYGGIFKSYWAHHFHSVTHECYAVVAGRSRLLLGVGPLDGGVDEGGRKRERNGVQVELGTGDVIVLPVST